MSKELIVSITVLTDEAVVEVPITLGGVRQLHPLRIPFRKFCEWQKEKLEAEYARREGEAERDVRRGE